MRPCSVQSRPVPGRTSALIARSTASARAGVDAVGLVDDHEVGAGELLLEQLLERGLVVDRRVLLAQPLHGRGIGGEAAGGDRRGVGDHHDAVDRELRAHVRPGEGLDQRLRQRQARGLDHDVVGQGIARQDLLHRRQEVVGDRAADAAVGELDHLVLAAAFDAAAGEDLAVDAEVAELVDQEGEAPAARVLREMADQAGLAGAEEAGDDGRGNPLRHEPHLVVGRPRSTTVRPWISTRSTML